MKEPAAQQSENLQDKDIKTLESERAKSKPLAQGIVLPQKLIPVKEDGK